jgi:serine/threonine protein kinase
MAVNGIFYMLSVFSCSLRNVLFCIPARRINHRETKEVMAVKEMRATTDLEGRRNFQHEIQLLRRLSHPNILLFIGVFILKACIPLAVVDLPGPFNLKAFHWLFARHDNRFCGTVAKSAVLCFQRSGTKMLVSHRTAGSTSSPNTSAVAR